MSSAPGFAYEFADPSLFPLLYDRMPAEVRDALQRNELPHTVSVVNWLCAQARGDGELALVLADSAIAVRRDAVGRQVVRELALLDDPVVAVTLYRNAMQHHRPFGSRLGPFVRDCVLTAVFAAVRDPEDPAWHRPDGLVSVLLAETPWNPLDFLPCRTAPFAGLVAAAGERLGRAFDAAAELLTAMRTGGIGIGTGDGTGDGVSAVDWSAIIASHRVDPLPVQALELLAQHPECPGELLIEAYRVEPLSVPEAAALPFDALDIRHSQETYGAELRPQTIRRGLRQGHFPVKRLLHETGTAAEVLAAIGHADAPEQQVADALVELVAPLGAHPAAWIHLYARMPRFRGPCAVLVAEAVERARTEPEPSWPRHTDAEIPARSPEGARAGLSVLLSAASDDAVVALVPHLDARAVQDLLRHARLGAKARDALLAAYPDAAAWWAAAYPDEVARDFLLDLDDPEVNAMLFQYGHLPADERRRILAGRPRSATRTGEIPVADRLVDAVLSGYELSEVRARLLDCVYSGDAKLVRILLGRAKVFTEVARLRLLVNLWERQGPEAVQDLLDETEFPRRRSSKHPLPPQTLGTARTALARDDGLAYLQGELANASTPDAVAAFLVGRGGAVVGDRMERVVEEIGPIPWDAVVRRHAAKPLDAAALGALAQHDDCPGDLFRALIRGTAPDDLRSLPRAVRAHLDAAELVATMRPARVALNLASAAEIRPLLAAPLGDSLESWAVAARLLPDFAGSLAELVDTAGAVTATA
ncbi:hypothetical protein [Yinghuangia sp. YIM S09857]|uniref:hypothetical protein n=1 Tax=Yinghuangia sp. YIM S09857 TaxID=3436929 RepID=UPI003F5316E4